MNQNDNIENIGEIDLFADELDDRMNAAVASGTVSSTTCFSSASCAGTSTASCACCFSCLCSAGSAVIEA